MKEIVLDTETTGLSVELGHRIVEIGCIELENQIITKNKFHYILNPQRKVSEEAKKVHGYDDKFLSDKKKFKEIADNFLNFIKNSKLIIHNASFDLAHLNNELRLIGKPIIDKNNVIDTLDLAREKYPGSQISLDALCKRFRIDNSRRKLHTALVDCELLAKVYVNLIDQKEPTLGFEEASFSSKFKQFQKGEYCNEIISPSPNEIKLHKDFLKTSLKKNNF